ncbi:hypothetical protein CLV28_1248 [Sediminihabitans luteus]|uniref:N-acetyltransferase domain-containing protein n=1 Tax=Sediminihabitans luteus TaxID=1138585 RepID=A0A2M9CPE3_9CELL|nr:GNAT family N-acetyltransferase [Sediminihabitans luteus]PJJ73770.1 hypothetical protein CLV28_1248 [Sediminihabitans luteus]GIJ00539.1 acetyltransferase [Sediminihabitans luteus]
MTDPSPVVLRPATPDDVPALVALNDAAHPAVPITSEAEMAALLAGAELPVVAVDPERPDVPLAMILAFGPGADYASENYAWFESRGYDHLYVDRIVVGEGSRDRGLGRLLYAHVFSAARLTQRAVVTCEVNLDPPNPGSLRFHTRLGFAAQGEQATKGGSVRVVMLSAPATTTIS